MSDEPRRGSGSAGGGAPSEAPEADERTVMMNPVAAREAEVDDRTAMMNPVDASRSSGSEGSDDEHTVAIGALAESEADDRTVVAPRSGADVPVDPAAEERTVAAPRVSAPAASASAPAAPAPYAAVPHPAVRMADDDIVSEDTDDDRTVVAPGAESDRTGIVGLRRGFGFTASTVGASGTSGTGSRSQGASGTGGMPVEEPETSDGFGRSGRSLQRATQDALDPARRIAPAPWEVQPEPGLRQGLPVVYGPRGGIPGEAEVGTPQGGASAPYSPPDAVQTRIGPPPSAVPDPRYAPRPPMPSLAKRARRSGIITLSAYAVAIAISVAGLAVIARLVFG